MLSGPIRIGPLEEEEIRELGLHKLQRALSEALGDDNPHEINFMLFKDAESVTKSYGAEALKASERLTVPLKVDQ